MFYISLLASKVTPPSKLSKALFSPFSNQSLHYFKLAGNARTRSGFGIIKQYTFQHEQKGFLNYLVQVEDRQGLYCWFHDDIDVECLAQYIS